MFRKLIYVVALAVPLVISAPRPANAFLSPLDIFKMILNACPGLPVLDFVSLPGIIADLPPTLLQYAQDKLKTLGQELVEKAKTGGLKSLTDFQIPDLEVPDVSTPTGAMATAFAAGGADDPQGTAEEVHEGLMVAAGKNNADVAAQMDARDLFYRSEVLKAVAYATSVKAQLADMPQIIDDLKGQSGSDENSAWRVTFSARQTLSKFISTYHKVVATRARLQAAKQISNMPPVSADVASLVYPHRWPEPEPETLLASLFTKPALAANNGGLFARAGNPAKDAPDESLGVYIDIAEAKDAVNIALEAHNVLYSLVGQESTLQEHMNTIKEHERYKWLTSANEGCNINLLSYYFNNPAEVWNSLSTFAQSSSEAATAAFENGSYVSPTTRVKGASSQDTEQGNQDAKDEIDGDAELNAKMAEYDAANAEAGGAGSSVEPGEPPTGDGDSQASTRVDWDVGRAILMHLYENQSDWGSVKRRFPLWVDQKVVYDRNVWDALYTPIQMYYKAYHNKDIPAGPTVSDTQKYYREYHSSVIAAHNAFIGSLPYPPTAAPTYKCNQLNPSDPLRPCYPLPPMKVVDDDGNEVGTQDSSGLILNEANAPIGTSVMDAVLNASGHLIGRLAQGSDPLPAFKVVINSSSAVIGYQHTDGSMRHKNGTVMQPYVVTTYAADGVTVVSQTVTGPLLPNGDVVRSTDGAVIGRLTPRGTTVVKNDGSALGYLIGTRAFNLAHNPIGTVKLGNQALALDGTVLGTIMPLNVDAPEAPPAPLPPWKEIVYMTEIADNFYPEIPQPWLEILNMPVYPALAVEGALEDMYGRRKTKWLRKHDIFEVSLGLDPELVPPGGELSQLVRFYELSGTNVFYFDDDQMPLVRNRIFSYLKLMKNEEDFRPRREEAEAALDDMENKLRDILAEAGIVLTPDFDITNKDDYGQVISQIRQIKRQKAQSAHSTVNRLPPTNDLPDLAVDRINELHEMLYAINHDQNGLLPLNYQNAPSVEADLLVAIADRAILAAQRTAADDFRKGLKDEIGCPIY